MSDDLRKYINIITEAETKVETIKNISNSRKADQWFKEIKAETSDKADQEKSPIDGKLKDIKCDEPDMRIKK